MGGSVEERRVEVEKESRNRVFRNEFEFFHGHNVSVRVMILSARYSSNKRSWLGMRDFVRDYKLSTKFLVVGQDMSTPNTFFQLGLSRTI
jgi:glycerol dehydrogenase-like iron-containing ADH family enzyme